MGNLRGPLVFWKGVSQTLCEECGLRPARVTVTRGNETEKTTMQLCPTCARIQGGWLFGLLLNDGSVNGFPEDNDELLGDLESEDAPDDDELEMGEDLDDGGGVGDGDLDDHIVGAPFDALMDACFPGDEGDNAWDEDPFDDEDAGDFLAPLVESDSPATGEDANLFQILQAVGGEGDALCPGCGATWTQIGLDERVGCARCYATFRSSLAQLLEYVQRAPHHQGKSPRAARKRVLRLEHLRQRRDHQLQLLQNRLAEAVRAERYEEAATLRDKIKLLSL